MPLKNFTDRLNGESSNIPSTQTKVTQVLDKAPEGNGIIKVSILNSTHEIMAASQIVVCMWSKVA